MALADPGPERNTAEEKALHFIEELKKAGGGASRRPFPGQWELTKPVKVELGLNEQPHEAQIYEDGAGDNPYSVLITATAGERGTWVPFSELTIVK